MKLTTQTAQTRTARKGFTLVELLVVIAIIAALAGVSYGPIMKQIGAADRSEAISNGKSINTALLAYYSKNREFPRDGVTDAISAFQILLDTGEIDDEKYFWNRNNGSHPGTTAGLAGVDNDLTLTAVENVWGYTQDLDTSDGSSPIMYDCVDTVAIGAGSFFADIWDGQALILRVDGSASAENIDFAPPITDTTAGPINEERNGTMDIMVNIPGTATVYAP